MKYRLHFIFSFCYFLLNQAHASDVQVLFAGDIVFDGKPGKMIAAGDDPFKHVASLFQRADLRIANFECVMAKHGVAFDKNFNFRANPDSFPALRKYIDAVSIANNHSGDYGPDAFLEMLKKFDSERYPYFGGGVDLSKAHQARVITKNGISIALLAYNEYMPRSFEAQTNRAGIAWSEDEQVISDIQRARQLPGVDLVIPYMHWGWENDRLSSPRQRLLARKMIDAGAAAVIGTHPHVTQEIELYKGKPIVYSLGNFIMDELDNEAQTEAWLIELRLNKNGVKSWQTQLLKLDANGVPAPVSQALSPCQHEQQTAISYCASPLLNKH